MTIGQAGLLLLGYAIVLGVVGFGVIWGRHQVRKRLRG